MAVIAGALPVSHNVDANGSLTLNVPLHFPNAKAMPEMSLAYHSASSTPSPLGLGWVLKGTPIIERVAATIAQDGIRGVVNYDRNDRFAIDGQRLVKIGDNEYRFEIEQWSKIVANGADATNPDSWTQHLPDGSTRTFGATSDSNIKALAQRVTRVWAISEALDAFSNYISFSYNNDTTNGSFHLSGVTYGGNKTLRMAHQRQISFEYENRDDKTTRYLGGYKIHDDKRLATITSRVQSKLVHKYSLTYDTSPLTKVSRLLSVTLSDSSGLSVLPLSFNWVDANNAAFDGTKDLGTISAGVSSALIIPQDVNASGRSDIVLASKQYDDNQGTDTLFLSVYLADVTGQISTSAAAGSGSTGLQYPTQLLPLDMNGNGKTDLVHIFYSSIDGTDAISVLLSTPDGYKSQSMLTFTPESMTGYFYSGDFEGNGRIGLIYVYQVTDDGGSYQLKFVQFTSDGAKFTALDAHDGPKDQTLATTHIIVGDFNGNGAEDVFLVSPKIDDSDPNKYCEINFLESVNGKLSYRNDGPLRSCASNVLMKSSTKFLAFAADRDGKTSLLVVSRDENSKLELQLLRNTGKTLIADPKPTVPGAFYSGNITLNRISSTNTVDLINSYDSDSGPQLNLFRFNGEKFSSVDGILQPSNVSTGAIIRWADLRGIGRADCLLNVFDVSSYDLTVYSMPCSSTQPIDYISSYDNGIGANVSITYAPLSDPNTYSVSGDIPQYPVASMNAMARNVASSLPLTASSSQNIARTRTELVHYPSFVVRRLSTCPQALQPGVTEDLSFTYANARVSFDGRGWLGFESISRLSKPVGQVQTTKYFQQFPLLGQISGTATSDYITTELIQANTYSWKSVAINSNMNYTIRLLNLKEVFYEAGAYAYDVSVLFTYDDFSNVTLKTITPSQPGVPPLSITSTFDNDTQRWVIGSKLSEITKQKDALLKQSKHVYIPGTRISKETSMWISDSQWSKRTFAFDKAGNEISAKGPKSAHRTFVYDTTYSNLVSATIYTNDKDSLTETATYDLALGKPITVTNPNGLIRSYQYDVLGRLVNVSEGESASAMTVIEKHSFQYTANDGFSHTRLVLSGRDANDGSWSKVTVYTDGLQRTCKIEKSRADDLDKLICSVTQHDGAGRVTAASRAFLANSQPVFAAYAYDSRSRLVQETIPPVTSDVPSVTNTYTYTVDSYLTTVTESRSDGNSLNDQVVIRKISHFPNPEPTTGKILLPYVTSQTNGLGQTIQTEFDGLGRPISIVDPSGVHLTMAWDGLSRQIDRCLLNGAGASVNVISHFTATFEDDKCQTTVKNVLTGSTKVTKTDYADRAMAKVTADETVTLLYDVGGQYSKGQLGKSTSSKGCEQAYDYDIRGHLTKSTLSIDGRVFQSTFEWTPAGQLKKATNPDGSSLTRSFLPDGQTVENAVLTDASGSTQASTVFSDFDNAISRPLTCTFGNGITSQSTMTEIGCLSDQSLNNSTGATMLQQTWQLGSFSRIQDYKVKKTDGASVETKNNAFQYDLAGQLISRSDDTSASGSSPSFSYDQSGNLSLKDGDNFINDGWQLTSVQDQQGATVYSFTYSVDGNISAKLDGSGTIVNSMSYDSEGRLSQLDGNTFVYDYGGRMIKATKPNGDVTYYPSQNYEVNIPAQGKVSLTSYLVHGYRRAAFTSFFKSDGKVDSTVVYYFHNDHLGSTVAVSNKSGTIITNYSYDVFGVVTVDGPDIARYKFSGKEQFGDMYYFGARFYDPQIGRFLTLDNFPVDVKDLTPSTFNMYTFSRNDPVNFIDVYGYVPWWHWLLDGVLTVVGVVVLFIPLPGMAFLGGAILGAGISGLLYDGSAQLLNHGVTKDSDYYIQLGLGAAFGLISAGVGALFDLALPAGSIAEVAVSRGLSGSLSKAVIGRVTLRALVRVGVNSASGAVLGAGQQAATNLIDGEPVTKDLGLAAGLGALSGGLFGALFEAKATLGLKDNFWTGKKWGVFHRAIIEYTADGDGLVRITLPYPDEVVLTNFGTVPNDLSNPLLPPAPNPSVRVQGAAANASGSSSISTHSNPGLLSRRFLPVYDVTSF